VISIGRRTHAAQAVVEIFPFQVLHHQVGLARFCLAEIETITKCGCPRCEVISASRWNRARASRLAARSRAMSLMATRLLSRKLHRLVHRAHAALAEQPRDAVRALQNEHRPGWSRTIQACSSLLFLTAKASFLTTAHAKKVDLSAGRCPVPGASSALVGPLQGAWLLCATRVASRCTFSGSQSEAHSNHRMSA